ncbi:hypothetical protein J6590_017444 [Homalodisca vitripennis]|nr:hypothetical protein J6590_017444 [Homalodisca vitripennis]
MFSGCLIGFRQHYFTVQLAAKKRKGEDYGNGKRLKRNNSSHGPTEPFTTIWSTAGETTMGLLVSRLSRDRLTQILLGEAGELSKHNGDMTVTGG